MSRGPRSSTRCGRMNDTTLLPRNCRSSRSSFTSCWGQVPTGGKQVHDANIVATMIAYDVRTLLTYNLDDYKRFSGFIEIADSL